VVELLDFHNFTYVPLHDSLYVGARPCILIPEMVRAG